MKLVDQKLPAMRSVMRAIRAKKNLQDVVAMILESSCSLTGARHGSFIRVDPDDGILRITATHGNDWTEQHKNHTLRIGEGLTGRCARDAQPVLCDDITKEPGYICLFEYVRSELVVPVLMDDVVWGLINLDGEQVGAFTEDHVTLMLIHAELAAFAIQQRIETDQHERLQMQLSQTEKLASLGKIIAGIAHEINNPLTSIVGHAQLLLLGRGGKEDEQSLGIILSQSERAAELVRGLLSFARKDISQKQALGINEIVSEVVSLVEPQVRLHRITLESRLSPVSYPVLANFREIQQVLMNLIGNAQDAIAKARADGGNIQISTARSGSSVSVTVRDNGPGIPAEMLKHIFDPFFTTKSVGKGTGLGLSIAHSIVAQHNGTLTVQSSVGHGCSFCLTLPIASSTPGSAPPPATPAPAAPVIPPPETKPAPQRLPRVLVVDDEPHILSWLTEFLALLKFDVDTAANGNEGLEKIRSQLYQVVISDLRMPGMNGLELYAAAKTSNPGYQKRFIFITGDLARQETRDFLKKTQCPYLEKPFSLKAVQAALDTVLAAHPEKAP